MESLCRNIYILNLLYIFSRSQNFVFNQNNFKNEIFNKISKRKKYFTIFGISNKKLLNLCRII